MSDNCSLCEQPILLRPEERDVCEGCRLRGGPPEPVGISPKVDTVEQRVKSYLRRLGPEQSKWSIENLKNFHAAMGKEWEAWNAELESESNPS